MAYTSMKIHYPHIDARLVASGPPEGKTQTSEEFLAEMMEGTRITEPRCGQNTLYF